MKLRARATPPILSVLLLRVSPRTRQQLSRHIALSGWDDTSLALALAHLC